MSSLVVFAGQAPADEGAQTPEPPVAASPVDHGPAEADDEATARVLAQMQDRPIEILDARTEDTSLFANPDGSFTTQAFASQVRLKRKGGGWSDIDTDLIGTDAGLEPRTVPVDLVVSDGGGTDLASVSRGDKSFGMGWETKLPTPTVKDDTAFYNLGNGQRLTVTALSQGFSQNVVLHEEPSGPVTYRIPLNLDGLTLSQADSGHLLLKDTAGKLVAEAPAPMMWDSSTDRASGESAHQAPVATEVRTAGDGSQTLVLTPDAEFFANATYPVTVDPTSTLSVTTDTWVATNYTDSQVSSTELKSGTYNTGTTKARSYLKFDVSAFKGKHIIDADLSLYSYYSSTCATSGAGTQVRRITSAWSASAVTWSDQPSTTSTGAVTNTAALGYSSSCPAGTMTFAIDTIAQAWADGTANHGLRIAGASETDSLTWRRYRSSKYSTASQRPKLSVTYNSYPSTATLVSPESGTATSSATPTFKAKATDADGDDIRYAFEVWDSALTTRQTKGNSKYVVSGTTASWTTGTLATGAYKWRAKAYDGTDLSSAWSSWNTLTVDTAAPTVPKVTSTSHSSNADWYSSGTFSGALTATGVSGISGYAVKIDRAPATSAGTTVTQSTAAVSATDKADGTWYVHAAARSKAGLWSATGHFAFNIDTTPPGAPSVVSSSHPLSEATYASRTASFSWTAPADLSGAATYTVVVDRSSATLPPTTGTTQSATTYSTTVSSDGTWYLHVRARDRAGNWSSTAAHFSFVADSAQALLPTITSSTHPDQTGAYKSSAFKATWSTTGSAAGYSHTVDASTATVPAAAVNSTSGSVTGNHSEGTWYLHVRAVDAAGNWGPTAHYRFSVDTTPPDAPTVVSPDYPDDSWTGDADVPGSFLVTSADKGLARISYSLDRAATVTRSTTGATTALELTPSTEGSHLLTVTATDRAGNTSDPTTYTFHVGTAGLTEPLTGEEIGYKVTLAAQGPSTITGATFQYRRGSTGTWTTIPTNRVARAGSPSAVTWPVAMTEEMTPELVWDTSALTDGKIELRTTFSGSNSPAPSDAVEVLLNRVPVLDGEGDYRDISEPTALQTAALDIAEQRAEESPDTFAPPYLDAETGEIVAPVTEKEAQQEATATIVLTDISTDEGSGDSSIEESDDEESTEEDEGADDEEDTEEPEEDSTTSGEIAPVSFLTRYNQGELDSIAEEILMLDEEDIPGVSPLVTSHVDAEHNRVIVTGSTADSSLADSLGDRYGSDAVAIRVSPEIENLDATAGRKSDSTPYKGGAIFAPTNKFGEQVGFCTTGFSWTYKGAPYMLTAGHCTTLNAYFNNYNSGLTVGKVVIDNWNNSTGSVKLSGQKYWSGDLSLMEVYSNKYSVSAKIFKGGTSSKSTRRVDGRWTTRSKKGQKLCTGGARSGEVCGWKVTETKANVKYDKTVAKNVTVATKTSGKCVISGDSGGPVYTVKKNGRAQAKGIISGAGCVNLLGYKDCDGWFDKCRVIFTDIALAETALPGGVMKK
ncbi:DNRLRE domain-containing protein [Streptomyces sp. NPDC093109]|uniref:DNRLRE domain-containing protein n=1 Tax=Streptomyces sp. NPDC093109 TaxID=3154977 RepID=UPI0034504CB2